MKTIVQLIFNTVLPIAVLVLAVLGFRTLLAGREAPDRSSPPDRGTLVEVAVASTVSTPTEIAADGVVVPAQRLSLAAEVTGRLESLHPNLVGGGVINAGEQIFSLSDRDYRISTDRARASVRQAEAALEIQQGQQRVAQREWEIFRDEIDEADSPLAVREPQVRSAQIAVELAETELRGARLNLSRTDFDAPFNVLVLNETAEVGQLVTPQTQLATLVGVDTFWIEVSIPLDALGAIAVPGINGTEGAIAEVHQSIAGQEVLREGRVVRVLPELSTVGRMARVIVAIEDPFDLSRPVDERRPPLLLGSYVRVTITGQTMQNVVGIPRSALHEGDRVYLADNGELRIREVSIAWRREDEVFVSDGVESGERYIVSPVPTAVDGMPVRVSGDQPAEGDDV